VGLRQAVFHGRGAHWAPPWRACAETSSANEISFSGARASNALGIACDAVTKATPAWPALPAFAAVRAQRV
jgi:hypothetical protein